MLPAGLHGSRDLFGTPYIGVQIVLPVNTKEQSRHMNKDILVIEGITEFFSCQEVCPYDVDILWKS